MLVQKYNSSDLCAKLWMKMGSICYKSTKLAHPSLQTMIHIVRVSCSLIDLPIVMHMLNYPHVADMYTHMWALLLLHDYLFSGKLLDFILQWLFLHSCEIKSGSGLRPRLVWLWLVWLLMLQYVLVTAVLENSRRSYPGIQCMLDTITVHCMPERCPLWQKCCWSMMRFCVLKDCLTILSQITTSNICGR